MIKKTSLLLLCLMLIFISCITANANSSRIYDNAELLQTYEVSALQRLLDSSSQNSECEIIVATENYLYTDADISAQELLSQHLATSGNDTGICLLVSLTEREYGIYRMGKDSSKIFTSSVLDDIEKAIKPYLKNNNVAKTFEVFATECSEAVKNYNSVTFNPLWILISLGVGIVIAFIVVFIMKYQLRSVRFQPAANNYLKSGSLNITDARDIYLYSIITRTARPQANSSGSSSGGGRKGSF